MGSQEREYTSTNDLVNKELSNYFTIVCVLVSLSLRGRVQGHSPGASYSWYSPPLPALYFSVLYKVNT